MGVTKQWILSKEDLEKNFDRAKVMIVRKLVNDGLLDFDEADKWCTNNGVFLLKKSLFSTLTNVFERTEEIEGHLIEVLKTKNSGYSMKIGDKKENAVKIIDRKDDDNEKE